MTNDKRLIEDYLPIEAISAEASREKSIRKGHISTLHLWWARRPLVACRAAVYGALVPASQFVPACTDKAGRPNGGTDSQKKSLGRANAAKFVKALCQYPGSPGTIKEAQEHILKAHADRLTIELCSSGRESALSSSSPDGNESRLASAATPGWVAEFNWPADKTVVTVEDILAGRAPRPRVLDMFAGGGAIPLEALRLGCEAYALDLNPVAHIIELCTLVYPQKFGKPDPNVRGMTGPKNAKGETTWGGLAEEVRYWGNWVLEKVHAEIGDLYPPIPNPEFQPRMDPSACNAQAGANARELFEEPQQLMPFTADPQLRLGSNPKSEIKNQKSRPGYLTPVAYLWTRTVRCKNPACGATVPLVKQTWLCKKKERCVALRIIAAKNEKRVRFEVVESRSEHQLGFDPADFSHGGNAACPWCGTVADDDYVKQEGILKRIGQQLMAVVCAKRAGDGKMYLSPNMVPEALLPDEKRIEERCTQILARTGVSLPDEPIIDDGKNSFWCVLYGFKTWSDVFSKRQSLALTAFCAAVRDAQRDLESKVSEAEYTRAVATYLGLMVSRTANFCSTLCLWNYTGGRGVVHSFSHQAVPVTWDYPESNPFYDEAAGWRASIESACDVLIELPLENPATVLRGNCKSMNVGEGKFDAVITDPPYYDNISYADLADFFYVWLKRSIGHVYPEHFAGVGTPKKGGDRF